jgi:hypothetical protein
MVARERRAELLQHRHELPARHLASITSPSWIPASKPARISSIAFRPPAIVK